MSGKLITRGLPPGDPSCRIPAQVVGKWQQHKAEAP